MNALSGLMNPAAIGESVTAAFDQGREKRRTMEVQNALRGYAENPSAQTAAAVAPYDPAMAIRLGDRETQRAAQAQQAQAQAQAQHQQQMGTFRRLLKHAATSPEGWQQALSAAQNMGLDTSQIPQQYDPQWAQQQLFIAEALEKTDPEELKGIAYELQMAGYEPGTPEFEQAARGVISNKYATEYVDENGNTRRRSALNLEPAAGGPQPGTVEDGYRFKGGDPANPSSWEPVGQGGQTAAPSATFSGSLRPIGVNTAGITSTYRTPKHNREVGGVGNSYHTRRGADGNALAIDSVPPRGMSMSAYAAQLRRANPNLDVINEGDHVHVEPKG